MVMAAGVSRWLIRFTCAGVLSSGLTVAAADWEYRQSGQALALISQLAVGPNGAAITAGLVTLGLAAIALGIALLLLRTRSWCHAVTAGGLAGSGIATILLCAVPFQPPNPLLAEAGRNLLHGRLFALQIAAALVAAMCWPLGARRIGRPIPIRATAIFAGFVVVTAAIGVLRMRGGEQAPVAQRAWLLSNHGWLLACAGAQLRRPGAASL
jgi:hypothetical protein